MFPSDLQRVAVYRQRAVLQRMVGSMRFMHHLRFILRRRSQDTLTGIGIVLAEVDQRTGYVTAARMLQSTGYLVLDEAVLKAFRQWRFEPRTVSHVRIPIRFLMQGVVPVV